MYRSNIIPDHSSLFYAEKNSSVSTFKSKAALLTIIGFFFSFVLSPYYYEGDQRFYRLLYDNIRNYNSWDEKFGYYKDIADAAEPAYLLIVNFASLFLEKDLFFSLVNGLLFGIVCLFFLRQKRSLLFCIPFLFNYYFVTLSFSAERLKTGLFFFAAALLFKGYKRYFGIILACLCQFQMIVLAASFIIYNANKTNVKVTKENWVRAIFAATVLGVVASRLNYSAIASHLAGKSDVYAALGWGGEMAVLRPAIFMVGALFCRKDKFNVVLAFTPILIAAYLFGSERFAAFGYFVMMYFAATSGTRGTLVAIPGMIFFGYGGIQFILSFLANGSV